jgi:hypothetical protein
MQLFILPKVGNEEMKLEYSIVLLAISIAFSGVWIGNSLKQEKKVENIKIGENLSLSEAADYLKLSEESIKKIIIQEEQYLKEMGSYSGMMFPYSIVYGEYIFSKHSLDEWVKETTQTRSEYSTGGIKGR